MHSFIDDILYSTRLSFEDFDYHDNNLIDKLLNMTIDVKKALETLRIKVSTYKFSSIDEEIIFFKEQKPEILSRLLFFSKIYQIETKLPNGSNNVIMDYLHKELDSLTFFFERNLDFYQYYRSKSTLYDQYYFVRGKADLRLGCDSSHFDKDPNFSTGYEDENEKILDNQDMAFLLKMSYRTLQRYRSSNTLPYFKIGQKIYYRASDIRTFVHEKADYNSFKRFEKEHFPPPEE